MPKQLIHPHSRVVTGDSQPKLPTPDQLAYGEIAVNYAEGVETLSIRNAGDNIVEFKPLHTIQSAITQAIDEAIGGGGSLATVAKTGDYNDLLNKPELHTWKPNVNGEGVISWTDDSTGTQPSSQNIRGPQGARGDRGVQGAKGEQGAGVSIRGNLDDVGSLPDTGNTGDA